MKIALSQNNFHIGNFEHNYSIIIAQIKKAERQNADLIVFPELAISGYSPYDFLEYDDFIIKCYNCLEDIAKECKNIAAIVGLPTYNKTHNGKHLFNSASFLAEGKILQTFNKGLIPGHDVFDEYRYFEPADKFNIIKYKSHKLAITIGEDLWGFDNKKIHRTTPMEELTKQKPDILVNIAASPFSYNQHIKRKSMLAKNAVKYNLPIIYVNQTGAHAELLFDGGSMTLNSQGQIVDELKYFEEDFHIVTVENLKSKTGNSIPSSLGKNEKIRLIHDGLIMGIRDYFKKTGFSKAILGLSGGIDSAVAASLTTKALGNDNVKVILMPSKYSSQHSVNDAVKLAESLKISYETIPITDVYNNLNITLEPHFANSTFDITEENMQSRIRAIILMAFSNKYRYLLLNASNKSEIAVGYTTIYGDMCGGLSVLGDVYKTEVYKLAHYINNSGNIIPGNTITKPPSAELRPNQKDSDSLPEYELLDIMLYEYIELQKCPKDIINKGYSPEIVNKIISLVNKSEHKRHQSPPVLRVSPKAFGAGRRIPIVSNYLI